jgi:hypothetical protein
MTLLEETYSKENITKISQTLQEYKERIKELEDRAVPTTLLTVRVQREKDMTIVVENIVQNIHRVEELLDKRGQLWTELLEYGSLQDLKKKEDKLHVVMEDVKQ